MSYWSPSGKDSRQLLHGRDACASAVASAFEPGPLEDQQRHGDPLVEIAVGAVVLRAELDAADVADARDAPVGLGLDDDVAELAGSISRPCVSTLSWNAPGRGTCSGFGKAPPFGKFLSPQHGFWQNAESAAKNFSADIEIPAIGRNTEIYFDDRLVPHIFAQDEDDAYFAQGYLHAKFRLWQMEFQTYAASGRLTEILGPGPDSAFLNNDRSMRRLGMVFGAKRSLAEMEKNETTKNQLTAYTKGVNYYIENLTQAELPLEYKLLNYLPEKWSPMKTALLLKYLSFDLTGSESDVEYSNAKAHFTEEDFNKMYLLRHQETSPIIPPGTYFPPPSSVAVPPPTADSLYFQWKHPVNVETIKTDPDNGSNNWVAAGSKTVSGRPILCNDPHLGLEPSFVMVRSADHHS